MAARGGDTEMRQQLLKGREISLSNYKENVVKLCMKKLVKLNIIPKDLKIKEEETPVVANFTLVGKWQHENF